MAEAEAVISLDCVSEAIAESLLKRRILRDTEIEVSIGYDIAFDIYTFR